MPEIPHKTCRPVIHNGHVPKWNPSTNNPNEALIAVSLYDSQLRKCNKSMSNIYKSSTVDEWIKKHIMTTTRTASTKK